MSTPGEEQGGLGDADLAPEPVKGAGESLTKSGEAQSGADSGEQGTKGASGRPHGTHGDETSGVA